MDMDIVDATGNPATNIGAQAVIAVTVASAASALADVMAAGRGGMNPDDMRAGRMLAQGDLRLVALALIARSAAARLRNHQAGRGKNRRLVLAESRHRLSDADLSRGSELRHRVGRRFSKKLYTITDEGRAYLETNRDLVDVVLDRLAALGERVIAGGARHAVNVKIGARCRRWSKPTFDHLRETVGKRLENDVDAEASLVEILARTEAELQRRS